MDVKLLVVIFGIISIVLLFVFGLIKLRPQFPAVLLKKMINTKGEMKMNPKISKPFITTLALATLFFANISAASAQNVTFNGY